MNDIFFISSLSFWFRLYPENPSINDIISCPTVLSTRTSICGNGKLSLGLAMFRPRKSIHILTFPSFFGTGTMLASYSEYDVTIRKPTFNCFSTSSFTFIDHSRRSLLNFCLTGMASKHIGRWWTIRSISSSSISAYTKQRHQRTPWGGAWGIVLALMCLGPRS